MAVKKPRKFPGQFSEFIHSLNTLHLQQLKVMESSKLGI